jgi:hypothetical protein
MPRPCLDIEAAARFVRDEPPAATTVRITTAA